MRTHSGGYRRDHLRALAQRVEVDAKEVRIMGSKIELRTLVAASSAKTAGFGVPSFVPNWRARREAPTILPTLSISLRIWPACRTCDTTWVYQPQADVLITAVACAS